MTNPSDQLKLIEMYRRLDTCHDYRILDQYIEVIKSVANDIPHPEFDKILSYAYKRRQYEFDAEFIGTVDIDMME